MAGEKDRIDEKEMINPEEILDGGEDICDGENEFLEEQYLFEEDGTLYDDEDDIIDLEKEIKDLEAERRSGERELQRRKEGFIRRKKRKKEIQITIASICTVVMIFAIAFIFFFGGVRSDNFGAEKVEANGSIAFYPKKAGTFGENFAKTVCETGNKDLIHDYTVSKLNSFEIYNYSDGSGFMTDNKGTPVYIEKLPDSFKMIVSDYLRYAMKKEGVDGAYSSSFLEDTYYKNININSFTFSFDTENLICKFEEYEEPAVVPLKYVSDVFSADLGIEKERYVKPVYIDPERPMVALTFDDGPDIEKGYTDKVLEELIKYDGVGTFFVVGARLYDESIPILQKGIERGNQYGSHSVNHPDLTTLDGAEITNQIMDVSDFFKENLGYTMNVYRPPYGAYDGDVDASVPLAAVLWDVDSQDWKYKNGPEIVTTVQDYVFDKAVVLLHDIHSFSAASVSDDGLIKWLVDEGYQLVDVNTVAEARSVELKQGVHFCWD